MDTDKKRVIERWTSPDILFLGPAFVVTLLFMLVINQQSWVDASSTDPMGPAFVPRLGLYIILGGILLAIVETRRFPSVSSSEGPGARTFQYLLLPAIVGGIYIYAAYALGLLVSTVVLLLGYYYANGVRRLRVLIPLAVVGSGLIYVFFMRILGLYFPDALLF